MQRILVVDNYDSFVYNLVQMVRELGCETHVVRNDKIDLKEAGKYDRILLSPGPGVPEDAGMMKELISEYTGKMPVLGVCLGHQAIGEVFGAQLENLTKVYHGVVGTVKVTRPDEYLFRNLPDEIEVGRYHSWVVAPNIPDELEITAVDNNGVIMALRHKEHDVRGVQFHPESVLTEHGEKIIENWLKK